MTATRSTPRISEPGSPQAEAANSGDSVRTVRGEVIGDERAARFDAFERRFSGISRLLDDLVVIPGTNQRIGLDPLVGLIPIVGDAVTGVVGFWLIAEATRFGIPRVVVARMALNTGLDLLIGAVPVVGDLFDIVSRSNHRNLSLFRRHALDAGADTRGEWLVVGGVGLVAVGVLWLVVSLVGRFLAIEIPTP
ncbi:MAG: hypothetical protein QOF49_1220 [Chloroflexota bacterium]|nr:hypothetical protein [Chloroflexota bacterium]